MSDFVIMTDSSCDLPQNVADELEIKTVPLSVMIQGKEYSNYLDGRDISFEEFYRLLRSGEKVSTSAINVAAISDEIEKELKKGNDVLCIAFSSGLSNTYNASSIAVAELSEKYPERKIYSVDSLCASLGQGLLVYLAVQEKKKGKSIDEVREWAEETKLHLCHWFTVDDLNFLKRGGRVSATTALVGTMLSIKPVMHVDDAGKLINVSKARGRKASLEQMVENMAATAIEPQNQVVFISHGDCAEDAEYVSKLVSEKMGVKKILINYVGPVIGAHSGPGTVALFYLGTKR